MIKKLATGLLAVFMISTAIVGMTAETVSAKSKQEKNITLKFWHWWADYQQFFEEMAEVYRMETGVNLDFQLFSPKGRHYWNKVQAAAQANVLPDIIGFTNDPQLLARYINADRIVELTKEMRANKREWEYSFYPRTVNAMFYPKNNVYKVKGDSYWGVPLSAMNIQIYYNKELFKKAGLNPDNPPKTWEAFLQANEKLKRAGMNPLIAGFGDVWVGYTFFRAYAWPVLGEDKMRELYLGDYAYTSQGCQQVLNYLVTLRDKKYLYPGVASMSNKEAEILFARERAAMMINGSWSVNVVDQMNPKLKFGVMKFPLPKDAAYPMYNVGGLGRGAVITENTKNRKEAIRFLKWLSSVPQQERLARVPFGFPANLKAQDSINPKMGPFVEGMKELAPNIFFEEKRDVLERLGKGVQSLLIGDETVYNILRNVQAVKQKVEKKK